MRTDSLLHILAICTVALLLFPSASASNSLPAQNENPCSGPYLDNVVYRVNADPDARILSLQAGDVNALLDPVNPIHVDTLEMDPDTDVHSKIENGYSVIDINCKNYPLNITGLRQAFAYAFDKNNVVSEVKDGHAVAHDSVFPSTVDWCIEDNLPWHYYSDQSGIGNQILNDLNFLIDGGTGFRLAPDGSPFEVSIIYSSGSSVDHDVAVKAADALSSLNVQVDLVAMEMSTFYSIINNKGDYGMAVWKEHYYRRDLDWILDNFHSDYVDTAYVNPFSYENASFDALCEDVLNAETYQETFSAVSEIQKHLLENVPLLVVYQDIDYQAYRTEELTGYIEDEFWGIPDQWTNLKVHASSGDVFGGVFTISTSYEPSSFNIFTAGQYGLNSVILRNLYTSLYKMGPDRVLYPDLAENMLVETHATNTLVPVGQTWITWNIRDNVVWSDSTHLDADDVASSFQYIVESFAYGNSAGSKGWVEDFLSAEALTEYSIKVTMTGNCYYRIQQLLEVEILPEHIFNDETGIGYDEWNIWNPVFNQADPLVTCGPFYVSSHDSWETELIRNMDYYWPSGHAPIIQSADDVSYVRGTQGNQIVWQVTDEDPDEYSIYRNDVLQTTESWDGSNIIYNVDGLAVGTYNFTLVLKDTSGWITTDIVWVTVTPSEAGFPDILTLGIGGGVVIILIIGVVMYKKK